VVEDDANMRGLLVKSLQMAGFQALEVMDGASGLELHRAQSVDLILLDLNMPGMDGFQVLKALRPLDEVPVLILTAMGLEENRMEGFSHGADDYLVKPFSMRELIARIRAILKRTSQHREQKTLSSGPFRLDRMNKCLFRAGIPVPLSPVEYHILKALICHAGESLTRTEVLALAWMADSRPSPRTVDVHMVSLRRKLILQDDPKWIISRGSHGYCWTNPVNEVDG